MAKRKKPWQQYIGILFFMMIGACCGILMMEYMERLRETGISGGEALLMLAVLFVGMYAAIFIQIIVHELGHLLFGLMTGYSFSSFRIGSFMWIKENDKIHRKRMSLAGTGGQCLMCPPEMKDGKIPYVLYNYGGSLLNLLSGVFFTLLYLWVRSIPILPVLCLMFSVIGVAYALMNGLPMRFGTVDNDGYNALSLGRSKEALRSFWIQMKVSEQMAKGVSIADMPAEWFVPPSDMDMKNSMTAVMGVFACNRLMTEKRFAEALALMKHYMEIDTAIVGLHRNLMLCDMVYCELIGENRGDVVSELLGREQKKFMKAMRNYPAVLRTEYTCAMLDRYDPQKAERAEKQFELIAKTYPYESDIESERELMRDAKAHAEAIRNSEQE